MSQGLKNLQTAARSCARRERLLDPQAQVQSNPNQNGYGGASHYTDDSGYADELEAEYDPTDGASERSGGSYGYGGSHQHTGSNTSVASLAGMGMNVNGNMGYMMNGVGGGQLTGIGGGVHQGQLSGVNGQGGVNSQGQRLPSMDMGIDAIINRPSGGR